MKMNWFVVVLLRLTASYIFRLLIRKRNNEDEPRRFVRLISKDLLPEKDGRYALRREILLNVNCFILFKQSKWYI